MAAAVARHIPAAASRITDPPWRAAARPAAGCTGCTAFADMTAFGGRDRWGRHDFSTGPTRRQPNFGPVVILHQPGRGRIPATVRDHMRRDPGTDSRTDPSAVDGLLVDEPDEGRLFRHGRRVRLGDVTPQGRLRLDAVVRYLQDIANDDAHDSGIDNPAAWVVRRTVVEVRHPADRKSTRLNSSHT